MDAGKIKLALADIRSERDPTVKSLKLASLCSALWKERGVQLVVVGGSAIELLTEGAYASGDIDMCTITGMLPVRERQEVMALLNAEGGPRSGPPRRGGKLRTHPIPACCGTIRRGPRNETRRFTGRARTSLDLS